MDDLLQVLSAHEKKGPFGERLAAAYLADARKDEQYLFAHAYTEEGVQLLLKQVPLPRILECIVLLPEDYHQRVLRSIVEALIEQKNRRKSYAHILENFVKNYGMPLEKAPDKIREEFALLLIEEGWFSLFIDLMKFFTKKDGKLSLKIGEALLSGPVYEGRAFAHEHCDLFE